MFHLFQSIKRHAAAVLQQRDHGSGVFIILFGSHAFRLWRRKHFAAQIAAPPVELIHRGRQRGLPDDSHQRSRFFLWIDFALLAARAVVARLHGRMRHRDFLGAGVGGSSVAPVPFGWFWIILGAGVSGCPKTFLVFSVQRGGGSIPANAYNALLSFLLSDSLNGACVPRSMIWSSSSRLTSMRGRFIVEEFPGTYDARTSPASASPDTLFERGRAMSAWTTRTMKP